jgi:hypothetical protein
MRYRVEWAIDFENTDCANVKEAACEALEIMRDPNSTAVVFKVTDRLTKKKYFVDALTNICEEIK